MIHTSGGTLAGGELAFMEPRGTLDIYPNGISLSKILNTLVLAAGSAISHVCTNLLFRRQEPAWMHRIARNRWYENVTFNSIKL